MDSCTRAARLLPLHYGGPSALSYPEGRIGYREWARWNDRLGEIHSLNDHYDHDGDELMA